MIMIPLFPTHRRSAVRAACLTTALVTALAACSVDRSTGPAATTPVRASDWISAVNWDERTVVTLTMTESGGSFVYTPNRLTFEAGKPYVLRIINPASNQAKHYVTPEGISHFYKAIATRKIETAQAEYKAPYFDAVELMVSGTLDLYFVPVIPGVYDIFCQITGHREAGMTGQITITGPSSNQLDLEMAPDFEVALADDARRASSHTVWSARIDTTVTIAERPTYAFVPTNLQLTRGAGYRIRFVNASGNTEKHYYTAADFFKTMVLRKAEDAHAEIKAPYLRAVELMVGGTTNLFVVPTRTGTFDAHCTLPQHASMGMTGKIIVSGG